MAAGAAAAGRPICVTPPIISSSEDEHDDSDHDYVENKEIIAIVTKAWQAEKLSPELLTPVEGYIDALRSELINMENNLRNLTPQDMRFSIHRMEVKRIRYIITSYLRLRLLKIQEYAWHYANELQKILTGGEANPATPFMTDNEIVFLKGYLDNLDGFLKDVALDHMPESFKTFQQQSRSQLRKPPNLSRFVFFRSHITKSIDYYDENNEVSTINLEQGCQYVMPYASLRRYVQSGAVTLL